MSGHRSWVYALPHRFLLSVAEKINPATGVTRHITVDLEAYDVEFDLVRLVTEHRRDHGKSPEGLLLGWEAFLVLCAQRQSFGKQEVHGVPVLVSLVADRMGRSVLRPSTSAQDLLQCMVEDGHFPEARFE